MTKPDGTVVSFQYDRNGQRVRKIVTKDNTSVMTSYIMVGGRIIHTYTDEAEKDDEESAKIYSIYVLADEKGTV